MRANRLARVPVPESVGITAGRRTPRDRGRTLAGDRPRRLARLDGLLSSAPCPPEVKQFVAGNLSEPPAQATLKDFAAAIAFFELPGRREIMQAIAERAADAEQPAPPTDNARRPACPRPSGETVTARSRTLPSTASSRRCSCGTACPVDLPRRDQIRAARRPRAGGKSQGRGRSRASDLARQPLQDRMIVAAAKTWRFQPATKDGGLSVGSRGFTSPCSQAPRSTFPRKS